VFACVYFYAPDSKIAILTGGAWRPNLQSSQMALFAPGQSRLLVSEDDGRAYRATLENYATLSTTVFAERGGTSIVSDAEGNVYIAEGQVWIYNRSGKQIGALETNVGQPRLLHNAPCLVKRILRNVDRDKIHSRIVACQDHRLRPGATAGFEHARPIGESFIPVEKFGERPRLVAKANRFTGGVTMNIGDGCHCHGMTSASSTGSRRSRFT